MFEDSIGQDTNEYYKTFIHAFINTGSLCERVCDKMTKGSAIEGDFGNPELDDIDERRTTVNMNETLKANEFIFDGCFNGRETINEDIIVCEETPKEHDTDHYAEILRRNLCSERKLPTRKTRDSLNPILRHHDSDAISVVDSEDDNNRPKIIVTQDDCALYANTRTARFGRKHNEQSLENEQGSHIVLKYTRSDSEIVYQNTSDYFSDGPSHIYENFEDKMKSRQGGVRTSNSIKSTTSNEASETESLYEDLDHVVYEAMSPPPPQRSVSKPIDIMYTSIDFSGRENASPISVGSCTNSSSLGSFDRTELRRCTSYSNVGTPLRAGGKPPELPQRHSGSFVKRRRPRSVHVDNQTSMTNFGLGLYTGTLVGCCIVMKTSPKSVQKVIGDYLAREKKEHSKPVSLNVTSEILRLSLNCAPWNLLAENSVDDIGCVKTFTANNKTALGYTISKPGEDTRLFVIHCSDADQIKEAIVKNFKRPETCANSLSRWSSMTVLGTPRPRGQSRSLPRMSTLSRSTRKNELASFDELVYLGSYKVKKSFLVVNDNIASVLDHRDSKDYTVAKIELYRDAIHLKNSREDRLLDIHQLEWILSMGLFDEDRRYFGYISSKAFQGSKTRTSCHVFRCNRVGMASQIMETIRQACQTTYLARTSDLPPDFRCRTNSSTSNSSEGSMSSSSETMSIASTSSTPPEVDWNQTLPSRGRRRPGFLAKRLSRNRMTTIQSFTEEDTDTGNNTLEEETPKKCIPKEKPHSEKFAQHKKAQPEKSIPEEVAERPEEVAQRPEEVAQRPEEVAQRPEEVAQRPEEVARTAETVAEEKLHSKKCTSEEKPQSTKCETQQKNPQEISEKRFNVFYLVSAIVSPPLKPKHVKECLKQYQKSVDKAMKKSTDTGQHYKKAELVLSPRGVMMIDHQTQTPQAFYERATISSVQSHPDGKCAFAFTTLVSGNTKHKCHLFLQDKDPIGRIVQELQTYIS